VKRDVTSADPGSRSGDANVGQRSRRRATILSLALPALAWFFASWVGLAVGLAAVAALWVLRDPIPVAWAAAVACLVATPLAMMAQGLPSTAVVGADFGTRHWLAADLVVAALVLVTFAALAELLDLGPHGPSASWRPSLALHERVSRRAGRTEDGSRDLPSSGAG
jgi:hypothetical protein